MLQWRACARSGASPIRPHCTVLRERCNRCAINGRMGDTTTTLQDVGANLQLTVLGIGALAMNKVRYSVRGYRSPRPYGNDQIEAVVDYSFSTVEKMRSWASTPNVEGLRILELGPGDNLCVGLILLGLGAESYDAADINDLALRDCGPLYSRLFERMDQEGLAVARARSALRQLNRGPLRYHVLEDFDLRLLSGRTYDRIWSQAAFEHFTKPMRTIGQLDQLASPEAELGVEIDLMTHTRALRSSDPLNIYRIPSWLYRSLTFSGIPNRYRTSHYTSALEGSGWAELTVDRVASVAPDEFARVERWLAAPFRNPEAQMQDLIVVVRGHRTPRTLAFPIAA